MPASTWQVQPSLSVLGERKQIETLSDTLFLNKNAHSVLFNIYLIFTTETINRSFSR